MSVAYTSATIHPRGASSVSTPNARAAATSSAISPRYELEKTLFERSRARALGGERPVTKARGEVADRELARLPRNGRRRHQRDRDAPDLCVHPLEVGLHLWRRVAAEGATRGRGGIDLSGELAWDSAEQRRQPSQVQGVDHRDAAVVERGGGGHGRVGERAERRDVGIEARELAEQADPERALAHQLSSQPAG